MYYTCKDIKNLYWTQNIPLILKPHWCVFNAQSSAELYSTSISQCSKVKTYFDTSRSEIWQLNHNSMIPFNLIKKKCFTNHLVEYCCLPFKSTEKWKKKKLKMFNIHSKRICSCILVCMNEVIITFLGSKRYFYFL